MAEPEIGTGTGTSLGLHELHSSLKAVFADVSGAETVAHYGDTAAEHRACRETAGVADLSFRGRLCLTGTDRVRLLHGQVTNDVARLQTGEGCYAAFVSNKGKLEADVNIYALANELLLDFEPGLTAALMQRLEHFIVADDVQIVDVRPYYGLISIQGPRAAEVVAQLELPATLPTVGLGIAHVAGPAFGDLYVARQVRTGSTGFDAFIPTEAMGMVFDKLVLAARRVGGREVGFEALNLARFEAGIPRFGVDMDASNLAPETGLESRAISYSKGCYIGQEVIARIRTYGQVAKALRGLRLADDLAALPVRGDRLFRGGKEVGTITSAYRSPSFGGLLAMAYVRRESNAVGTELELRTSSGSSLARIVDLPFR
jgi:folate-binding protein YgfZ